MRIKFRGGLQRRFLNLVIEKLRATSLRGVLQFGFDVPYSTLKSYYSERRLLPSDFFEDLCEVAGIDKLSLKYEEFDDNWGQARGGRVKNCRNK